MSRFKERDCVDKIWVMFTSKDHWEQLKQLYLSSRRWILGNSSYNGATVTQQQHQQLLTPNELVQPELRMK